MFKYKDLEGNVRVGKIIGHSIIGLIALFLLVGSWVTVQAGQRGVVLRFGEVNRVLDPGVHFKIPFAENVISVDVTIQKEQVAASAASRDLQTVSAQVALNYSIDSTKIIELVNNVSLDYKSRVIDPAIQESVKASTAKYTAEELITKRALVKDEILASLRERLVKDFIHVSDVSITDFDFSGSFNAAIEAKVTAEQDALAAKNKLEQVKFEAEQRVAQAEAEAQAIRLQSNAANNDNYVQLKALEVELEAVKKWNGQLPQQMIPNATLPFVNLTR